MNRKRLPQGPEGGQADGDYRKQHTSRFRTSTQVARLRSARWGIGAVACLMALSFGANAQPAINLVLDQVRIVERGDCTAINVEFTFPLQYIKHFPTMTGDILRIKLAPVNVTGLDAATLQSLEAMRAPPHNETPLIQVVYEGDIADGPFLTVVFDHRVRYSVRQGRDFRSLTIMLPPPGSPAGICPAQ